MAPRVRRIYDRIGGGLEVGNSGKLRGEAPYIPRAPRPNPGPPPTLRFPGTGRGWLALNPKTVSTPCNVLIIKV